MMVDNNCQSRLFLYIGWFSATCSGLTGSHHQANKTQNWLIIEEWKTNLMSLAILFHFLCVQHVSDVNISIIRSLRLCCWITTSVILFSVRCVLELLVQLVLGGVHFAGWSFRLCFSLQNEHDSKPTAPNLQHTTNWEQDDRCGNSTTQSQAPDNAYINVRNMLST